jgi:catechol 2,3-dioxygenase-like lactoylglutathione lyase family enzyme
VIGIHHLGLTVGDVDASADWYERVLGFRRVGEFSATDGARRKVFLRHADLSVRLGLSGRRRRQHQARHSHYRRVSDHEISSGVGVGGRAARADQPERAGFRPRQGARGEDDGYLLSVWWNRQTQLSELLVHDAAELRRTPLARVRLPSRIPFGFHGNWTGAAVLDQAIAARSDSTGR